MIDGAYVQRMARYNRWQNENLYDVADRLSAEERRRARGAFFGSIENTLNHLLWGDQIWMSRFADTPKPKGGIAESVSLYGDWEMLKSARADFDQTIIDWADTVQPEWLAGDLTYFSGAIGREVTAPRSVCSFTRCRTRTAPIEAAPAAFICRPNGTAWWRRSWGSTIAHRRGRIFGCARRSATCIEAAPRRRSCPAA